MRKTALRNNAREPFRRALASNIYDVLDQMDSYVQASNNFWEGEVRKVYLASRRINPPTTQKALNFK